MAEVLRLSLPFCYFIEKKGVQPEQLMTLIGICNLQFQKKLNLNMFNQVHFYPLWQPTFIYIPNFVGNLGHFSISPLDYKITEGQKNRLYNQNGKLILQNTSILKKELDQAQPFRCNTENSIELGQNKLKQKISCEITEVFVEENPSQKKTTRKRKSASKLLFDVEWKNQNRNIIPNIMNQMFSFLQKRHKSEQLIEKLFSKYEHSEECSKAKYYSYMKRMKSSMGHYVNQNELQSIKKIQEPEFSIYSKDQQLFYLKISRVAIDYFFMTQSVLISLTSNRMSHKKRKAHLIARRALLQRVYQLFKQAVY